MATDRLLQWMLKQSEADRRRALRALSEEQRKDFRHCWRIWARDAQLAPETDWRIWLILAGRGFGKTRAGAEWIRAMAAKDPDARIALIAASLGEARAVMVEGDSGILSICSSADLPEFEPSLRRLTWRNGATATLFSAGEPESLRGPQHSHAWCDEIGKWDNAAARAVNSWDNLMLGLRLGDAPRAVATTTPRAVPLIQRLLGDENGHVVVSRGKSDDNAEHLPTRFLDDMRRQYGQSLLARQELDGELIADVPGALWSRGLLEASREPGASAAPLRVVIGVDPPASAHGDACGIVVAALGEDGLGRVLADASIERPSPEQWARAVANAAQAWDADRVVAEANQGGAMVESVLRAADVALPLRLVRATRGKAARAEPVAALYEAGRVRHAGTFPALEDQLCGMMTGADYRGPGNSPDRADALVWAMTDLMLNPMRTPRIRVA